MSQLLQREDEVAVFNRYSHIVQTCVRNVWKDEQISAGSSSANNSFCFQLAASASRVIAAMCESLVANF